MLNGRQTSVSHTYVRTAGMFAEGLERERCSKYLSSLPFVEYSTSTVQ